jgi:hypothetical protein
MLGKQVLWGWATGPVAAVSLAAATVWGQPPVPGEDAAPVPEAVQAQPVPDEAEVLAEPELMLPAPVVPISAEELNTIVAELSSEDVERRVNASLGLQQRTDVRLVDLERVLERDDLSAEQRRRLLGAGLARFYAEPRAALGFSADLTPGTMQRGVLIRHVEQGFPASDVLRANDRIIAVDGVPLPNFEAIRPIIVSRDPGDHLELTVVRDGATLEVRAELGDFSRLSTGRLDEEVRAAAWELRSRKFRGPRADPIPSGLPAGDWVVADPLSDLNIAEVMHAQQGADGSTGVVLGGEARGGVAVHDQMLLGQEIELHLPRGHLADPQLNELRRLQQTRSELAIRLAALDRQLADQTLPRERRDQIIMEREALAQALANFDRRIEATLRQLIARDR